MNIVLFQPQIPQNTGNIIRTCTVTGSTLILVEPLGFSLSEKKLKRAGLDYLEDVSILTIDSLENFILSSKDPIYFFSSKAKKSYTDISYTQNTHLVFGSETSGLPSIFHELYPEKFVTIPMKKSNRCLNLSNAAAIALYEAYRQQNFFKTEKAHN